MCNTQVFINWGQSFTLDLQGPEASHMEINNLKSQHKGTLDVNWWVWIRLVQSRESGFLFSGTAP